MNRIERIWNGWRWSYIQGVADSSATSADGSVFTQILNSGLPDSETHIVYRGEKCFAILNSFPYGTGHTLLLPYREVAELESLDDAESAEIWALTNRAVAALKRAYSPDGLNVGINLGRAAGGSVSQHLHIHVVPRWTGDGNFMTAVANARTLPEPLDETARRVREAWV